MYEISKEFEFSASHCLRNLPKGHKCTSLHGHNYIVKVVIKSFELEKETGFVLDYGDLKPVRDFIDEKLDHSHLCFDERESDYIKDTMRDLNDVETKTYVLGNNTSAENIAIELRWKIIGLLNLNDNLQLEVHVSETPKTWAVYKG